MTRHAHASDLDDAVSPDPEAIALGELLEVQPARREVLADVAGLHVHTEVLQYGVELFGVNANRTIWPSVKFAVAAGIAGDAFGSHHGFENGRLGHPARGD